MISPKRLSRFLIATGIGGILLGEGSILLDLGPLRDWVTPFCWTGYIFLLDGLLLLRKGHSPLLDDPARFFWSFPLSTVFWLIFEGYNVILRNWEYIGLPEPLVVRWFGYAWAFGTILPALLETNACLETFGLFRNLPIQPRRVPRWGLWLSFCLGLFMMGFPLMTRSPLDFPPIWLGFIFLLEPLLYWFGGNSLLKEMEAGKMQRLFTLLVAGVWMGVLWEFWNYWATTKWVYHVPYPTPFYIFEMPLTGFFGFLPFGVEFYLMHEATRLLVKRLPRPRLSS